MAQMNLNGPARQLAATIKAYAEKKEAEGDKPAATEATASKAEAEEPAKTEEKAEAAPAPEADAPSAE